MTEPDLPIEAVLPALRRTLRETSNVVLEAPPGAGKTTRVPLALWHEPWAAGRIVMLEPRRIAARAAARRMAETLGETIGQSVGYRTRGDTQVSAATRIEVVTEGILARMAIADPALDGISAVIFDEVHERNLNTDLALALCLELQAALRPEMRLVAMSATLDTSAIAATMGDAQVIRSAGTQFDVETRWASAPLSDRRAGTLANAVTASVQDALRETDGSVLAFLPGAAEINRAAQSLGSTLPSSIPVHRLFAAAPAAEQTAALSASGARRIVLASAIAETSLTVPGVRVVIDGGLARRARFDPASGMGRLVTERVSRAEADQRRGRAGRQGPGLCIRLWTRGEHGGLQAYPPPEIAVADLAPLVLACGAWGSRPETLPFIDPPPAAALAEARALLVLLGALDGDHRLTDFGRSMATEPLHPRLAAMVLKAGEATPTARLLAALLNENDPLSEAGADIAEALRWLTNANEAPKHVRPRLQTVRAVARRLGAVSPVEESACGALLARAYPDRVAQRRPGVDARWLLGNGKGAWLRGDDPLANQKHLVVADLDGNQREALIRRAIAVDRRTIEETLHDLITTESVIRWDPRQQRVTAHEETRLGALLLSSRPLDRPDPERLADAMLDGVKQGGITTLPWSNEALSFRARVAWARDNTGLAELPDWSDEALTATLDIWLRPWLNGIKSLAELEHVDMASALKLCLAERTKALDQTVPSRFTTPAGRTVAVDYAAGTPKVRVRAQWLYGLDEQPAIADAPLLIELLSPADRAIALTQDLPGFWRNGWIEVRKDMRGRYPRHPWPEQPWLATPSTGTKRRA